MDIREYLDLAKHIRKVGREEKLKRREVEIVLLIGEINLTGKRCMSYKEDMEHFGVSLRTAGIDMRTLRDKGLLNELRYTLTEKGRRIYDKINTYAARSLAG